MYKNYIFDLGGVIAELDMEKVYAPFRETMSKMDDAKRQGITQQLMKAVSAYQRGVCTTDEFLTAIQQAVLTSWSLEQILAWWNGFVEPPVPERLDCLRVLRQKGAKVYVLSNINDVHWEMLIRPWLENPRYVDCYDRLFLSHKMGMEKPNADIYAEVIRLTGMDPSQTLYIDDMQDNIEAGKRAGLHVFKTAHGDWMPYVMDEACS